jgi:hypothetical protein
VADDDTESLADAVLLTVVGCLESHGADAAEIEKVWSDNAQMWFVEVRPHRTGAASVSVIVDGDELLLSFGKSRTEIWRGDIPPVERLRMFLDAIFAGDFEEAGLGNDRFVRGRLPSGRTFRCGSMHLPIPWVLRRKTRYLPYS